MILEIADLRIKPGQQAPFEKAVRFGLSTVLGKAKGYRSHQVRHSIESPERYVLLIEWETLEDHTVGFRLSPAFSEWRGIVFDFFDKPPSVEHFALIGDDS